MRRHIAIAGGPHKVGVALQRAGAQRRVLAARRRTENLKDADQHHDVAGGVLPSSVRAPVPPS